MADRRTINRRTVLASRTTGAVEQGPADRALTRVAVSVVDGRVLTA